MSRYQKQLQNGEVLVVGWDPALETFFEQRWKDGDTDEVPYKDTGNRKGEISTIDELNEQVGGILDDVILGSLKYDQEQQPSIQRAPALQGFLDKMENIMDKAESKMPGGQDGHKQFCTVCERVFLEDEINCPKCGRPKPSLVPEDYDPKEWD